MNPLVTAVGTVAVVTTGCAQFDRAPLAACSAVTAATVPTAVTRGFIIARTLFVQASAILSARQSSLLHRGRGTSRLRSVLSFRTGVRSASP